jgi:2-keto-3-deoxy-galactonokinase
VAERRFDEVLDAEIAAWERAHADVPILASSMISSRHSWSRHPMSAARPGKNGLE